MKALIQRVIKGSVSVDGVVISSIGRGLVILVGISQDDRNTDMDFIVKKILNVRLFDDDSGKRWSKSVVDKQYEVLCISQFTLYHTMKGNKPDFRNAMKHDDSREFYFSFIKKLKDRYNHDKIYDGVFGAMMQVDICNDGPVTIQIESTQPKNIPSRSDNQQESALEQ